MIKNCWIHGEVNVEDIEKKLTRIHIWCINGILKRGNDYGKETCNCGITSKDKID